MQKKKEILIRKLDDTLELFDEGKLRSSLERAGASFDAIENIVAHVKLHLVDGMTTSHIYKYAYEILKKKEKSKPTAARYSLKRAVIDLGPTGFPFEKFVGEIFRNKGYKITLGSTLEGGCAPHEIDVIAEKGKTLILVEAKFHNQLSVKSDLKVALYVKARYEDLEKSNFGGLLKPGQKHQFWIVTNTDFTSNAIHYGKCVGMKMIGWSHPAGGGLQDLIEETALHPLTCLSTLSVGEKTSILNNGNVLCQDIKSNHNILRDVGLSGKKFKNVLNEVNQVCVPRSIDKKIE